MSGFPLASGTKDRELQLDDPDKGSSVFERLYQVARIDVSRDAERKFDWKWRISERGSATIIRGQAHAGTVMLEGAPPQTVLMMVSGGAVEASTAGQRFELLAGLSAGIANADTEIAVRSRPGTQTLNIRMDQNALAAHAAALLGAPIGAPPRFESFIDLRNDAGADILRLAQLLQDGCARPNSPLGSPHVIAHLREALYSALLVGQKNTHSRLLNKPASVVNTRAVKQAEEILAARAAEPLSIADIAEQTGVGLRSLERSFKTARGCSLRDFLKAQRLELAHRHLCTATPGTTVTQVLYASGFSHPGEFSLAYRKRFGEVPSDTLRRAAGESAGESAGASSKAEGR